MDRCCYSSLLLLALLFRGHRRRAGSAPRPQPACAEAGRKPEHRPVRRPTPQARARGSPLRPASSDEKGLLEKAPSGCGLAVSLSVGTAPSRRQAVFSGLRTAGLRCPRPARWVSCPGAPRGRPASVPLRNPGGAGGLHLRRGSGFRGQAGECETFRQVCHLLLFAGISRGPNPVI